MLISIKLPSISSYGEEISHDVALRETGFYGRQGSGVAIQCSSTKRFLLVHRSEYVEQPHTWNFIGGAIDDGYTPEQNAVKEVQEETGYKLKSKLKLIHLFKSGSFKYFNFYATVKKEFTPKLNWESQGYGWFERDNFPEPLHFGIEELIKHKAI